MTAPVPTGIAVARAILIGVGALLLGVAGGALVAGVPPQQWLGILLWLASAVVLHDAVFAPLVLLGTRLLRRVGARVSWLPIAIVQVALVVGAALTLIAFPAIRAQQVGARNPSVLVFDYAAQLGLIWAALGLVTALLLIGTALVHRRRRARTAARLRSVALEAHE